MSGTIFRQDLPQGVPNVVGGEPRGAVVHADPDLASLPVTRRPVNLVSVDFSATTSRPIAADPADDVQQLMTTYRKALPGLKQSVRDSPLCGVCWRALAFAQLILLEDDMATQGFQMADDLERSLVFRRPPPRVSWARDAARALKN
jgi:hypothetical protein